MQEHSETERKNRQRATFDKLSIVPVTADAERGIVYMSVSFHKDLTDYMNLTPRMHVCVVCNPETMVCGFWFEEWTEEKLKQGESYLISRSGQNGVYTNFKKQNLGFDVNPKAKPALVPYWVEDGVMYFDIPKDYMYIERGVTLMPNVPKHGARRYSILENLKDKISGECA